MILAALVWHALTIAQVVAEDPHHWRDMHTHIEVVGFVTYVKREDDGDWHIRICDAPVAIGMDREHCMVAEIIPSLPRPKPKKGDKVKVRGISRFDAELNHGWFEVHPVLELEVLP